MLQVNLLLPMTGKTSSSFAVTDLMRLPLGILSGMGFIGAGAIVRKDNFVHGLTTAATLWFVTGLGLCFGGGQLALGLVGLTLGVLVLEVLKRVEDRWRQDRHAMLSVIIGTNGPTEKELTSKLQAEGYVISPWGVVSFDQNRQRELRQKCAGEHAHTKRILLRFCKKLSTIPEYSGWSGNREAGFRSQEHSRGGGAREGY
jgi:putative Mg2+ transporter-C (MgtC) family protein